MSDVFKVLEERGFVKQYSHEEVKDILRDECVTFYTGYDATADSLHVGHYLQLMAMAHMQKAGHRPISLIGGGTTMVGDPSGRSDMRKMMTREDIEYNAQRFRTQISKFLDFSEGKAIMEDNANWLLSLNYIEVLREVGSLFSVNKMLTADCYKNRLEQGLTFLEFNYMIMQAYDFLMLNKLYGCKLQTGGDDQWSNILSGMDLIRRKERKPAYALTFSLLTTSDGKKMGKTQNGALWLDAKKTSPYDFYQYWRNVEDADVRNCLSLLTFLPMEEINKLASLKDKEINAAKEVLAYETTKQVHGEQEAKNAMAASQALFGAGQDLDSMPTAHLTAEQIETNKNILDMLIITGMAKSKSDARRLIEGGGIYVGEFKVPSIDYELNTDEISQDGVIIRKGKKHYHRVMLYR